MSDTVFVVHWDHDAAAEMAAPLRQAGYRVHIEEFNAQLVCEAVSNCLPLAAIVNLDHDPEAACDLACVLTETGADVETPIVFIGGTREARQLARRTLPDSIEADAEDLVEVLRRLRAKS